MFSEYIVREIRFGYHMPKMPKLTILKIISSSWQMLLSPKKDERYGYLDA
jgi:hypothetical protein